MTGSCCKTYSEWIPVSSCIMSEIPWLFPKAATFTVTMIAPLHFTSIF